MHLQSNVSNCLQDNRRSSDPHCSSNCRLRLILETTWKLSLEPSADCTHRPCIHSIVSHIHWSVSVATIYGLSCFVRALNIDPYSNFPSWFLCIDTIVPLLICWSCELGRSRRGKSMNVG